MHLRRVKSSIPVRQETRENSPSSPFKDSKEIILQACNVTAEAELELQRPLFWRSLAWREWDAEGDDVRVVLRVP